MKLHPLHTPAWLNEQVVGTGCYPDISRCTGRTTSAALAVISRAIEAPGQAIRFQDHQPTEQASRYMADMIRDMIKVLGLEHMHVDSQKFSVLFARHETAPGHGEYVRCARM